MAELVRARINGIEKNVGRKFAEKLGLEVLDEPTTRADGRLRGPSRRGGRAVKKKTSVAEAAAAKQAVTEPADNEKEQDQ